MIASWSFLRKDVLSPQNVGVMGGGKLRVIPAFKSPEQKGAESMSS